MTTTTHYGTWHQVTGSVMGSVIGDLREVIDPDNRPEIDLRAVESAYRDAINAALPDGVTLNGDDVYGPYPREVTNDELREIIDDVELWPIIERFDSNA